MWRMVKVRFWVYNAVVFWAFTAAFSVVVAATFWSLLGSIYLLFLAMEFFMVIPIYWFLLKHVIELRASRIIAITASAGWPLASLLLASLLAFWPRPYWGHLFYFLWAAGIFSLFHCIAFSFGALLGAAIPISLGERLKRKLVFAIARGGDVVDLLELAVSLQEDPLKIRETVLHLLEEGYIEGYVDQTSNKLHVGFRPSSTPVFTPPTAQGTKDLTRELDVVIGLLVDLEEMRSQGRVSELSYWNLRGEYERRLRQLKPPIPVRESPEIGTPAEYLYKTILEKYVRIWGSREGGKRAIEKKINAYKNLGLNREEAILKIAKDEFRF